ncbi:interferon-induced protein with tetratricopeptide repeats 5-like [Heptranchias perlo]|uniref:interferon-induced protein with tetratricopeptide repeats 5-like n=1 Tax=Heptranchias perlo TaxID=212740 RepID=UPI003559E9CA
MVEVLNEYFASVFTKEEDAANVTIKEEAVEKLDRIKIDKEEALKRLAALKVEKSPGPDGMHPRLLREVRVEIAETLATIFQSSLNMGVVPEDRRIANVTSLFKKGEREKPDNYRPVSLMSLVEKLLETLEGDPDDIEWNAAHATALFRLKETFGDPQRPEHCKAVNQLHRALALNPNDTFVKIMLALRLQEFNQTEECFRLVEEVLLKSPDDPYIIQYAAKFLRKQRSVEYSLQLLKKALKIKSSSALLHHQIGLCYKSKLIALKKTRPKYINHGERKELIELCKYHFQTAFDQKPSLIFAIFDLAEILAESGEHSKADDIYVNLLRNEDCSLYYKQLIRWNYGQYELHEKRSQLNAIHLFKECSKLKVNNKKNEECRAKLKQIAEDRMNRYSRDSVAFGILGLIHQVDGKKSEAIEFFKKALEGDPENEEYRSALRELHQVT